MKEEKLEELREKAELLKQYDAVSPKDGKIVLETEFGRIHGKYAKSLSKMFLHAIAKKLEI